MNREPYWEFMARKLREERNKGKSMTTELIPTTHTEMWQREVAEMQKVVHDLQIRIIDLVEQVGHLNQKVKLLGGEPKQMEMRF